MITMALSILTATGYRQTCTAVLHSEAKVSDLGWGVSRYQFGDIRGAVLPQTAPSVKVGGF